MNIDRGKTAFEMAEREALRDQLREYKAATGLTWTQIGQKAGMNHSTLSAICSNGMDLSKYSNDIFGALHRFFMAAQTLAEIEDQAVTVPGFQATKTSRRIINLCNWARRGNIVAIVGDPGLGKTASLDQYRATTPNAYKVTASPSISTNFAILRAVEAALQATPYYNTSLSNRALSAMVRDGLRDAHAVLIIDEAQWCSEAGLEELRAIHDETKCGLVLAGNRQVLSRLEGKHRAAAYAQLFSRISFRHLIERPEPDDVQVLLDAWKVTSPKERDYLNRIAMRPGGGGLRQMSKVLELASITALGEGQLEERCLTHIEDAAAQLNTRLAA